jgi:phosphoglycerate dehydrogenase-like enzyme
VVVCGTGSGSEPPTELTWALLLALARNIVPEATAFARGGPWQSTVGSDLSGCQLGLLGFGKIGTRVAKIAKAFGMKVVAWSQNLKAEVTEPAGVELAPSKESLLASSDFVSIHLVLSDRTRHLIGATEFAQMRPSSYLINTSRAAIVDQEALVQALKTGQIAGAGVDVFDIEPLPVGHPLRNVPNLVATPHLGYVTGRNYRTYFTEAVDDIRAFLAGAPVRKLG